MARGSTGGAAAGVRTADTRSPDAPAAIRNLTRGTTLHERPRWALTPWQQARGLLFRRPRDDAIIFLFLPARPVTLHMWFVFGPIDVLALDGTGRVVALKERFLPWAFWRTGAAVSTVLELPDGTIARTRTNVGDVIGLPQPPRRAA